MIYQVRFNSYCMENDSVSFDVNSLTEAEDAFWQWLQSRDMSTDFDKCNARFKRLDSDDSSEYDIAVMLEQMDSDQVSDWIQDTLRKGK